MTIKPELIQALPLKRLKAVDGMAVTADVWEAAHDFHRAQTQLHALLSHGVGVVTGLEVIASDPPGNGIFLQPGLAIDANGQMIALTEPKHFPLARSDGMLYVVLTYGESRAQTLTGATDDGTPLFIQSQYALEATQTRPAAPYVELARIRRVGRDSVITNPANPALPCPNEIDQRFRQMVGAAAAQPATVGVAYLGAEAAGLARHGRGAAFLAHFLRGPLGGRQPVWVDDNVPLTGDLQGYTLVYLVAQAAFALNAEELRSLYTYLQNGGTVFFESCHNGADANAVPPGEASFQEVLTSLGVTLEPLAAGHPLMTEPALFGILPAGFETSLPPRLRIGGGIIHSTGDYGCVWQGERRGRPALRDEIRSAMEWGANLLALAEARRQAANASRAG